LRELRADAARPQQQPEGRLLGRAGEAVEREGPFARMRVDAERDGLALVRQHRVGRERDEHLVADAAHVEHDARRRALAEHPLEARDHDTRLTRTTGPRARRRLPRGRGASSSRRPAWAWQSAAASASAASAAGQRSSASSRATTRWTWSLPARPLPHTQSLMWAGVYSTSATPAAPSAASAAPRA